MTANKKLKPCPFCGSEAMIVNDWSVGFQKEMYTVECTNDECTATINKMKETQDEVIKIWNRRVDNKITKFDDKEGKKETKKH